ncbi:MAG: hypothetical protein K1X83_09665 [Oligoflexia bacterium]|nr:hypothetical protein [Oligoflexia bacterium]
MLGIRSEAGFGKILRGAAVALLALGVVGCSGSTNDESTADVVSDGSFVDSDGNVGSLTLNVKNDTPSVGSTSAFSVVVHNQNGQPVPGMRVTCDTERGLAILEPTTGSEITDSFGGISGVIGCAAPGSLQIGCRLSIGASKRKFATVKCQGPVPAGFSGFGENVAGGTLGGGVNTDDDSSNDTDGLRITSIDFIDNGDLSSTATSTSIDTVQGCCEYDDSDACISAEPFFDTYVKVKVVNNTNQNARFTSLRYRVPNGTGDSTATLTSSAISLIGDATVEAEGGETSVLGLFADAVTGGNKRFAGSSSNIGSNFGFRNVRVTLSGTDGAGNPITVSASIAASLDNFNQCG